MRSIALPEIAFAPDVTSATVVKFISAVFSREGNPLELVTDNGSQFVQLSSRHSLQTEILNTTVALSITPKRMVRLNASIECSKTLCRPLGLKVKSGKLL